MKPLDFKIIELTRDEAHETFQRKANHIRARRENAKYILVLPKKAVRHSKQ